MIYKVDTAKLINDLSELEDLAELANRKKFERYKTLDGIEELGDVVADVAKLAKSVGSRLDQLYREREREVELNRKQYLADLAN
jgi:NTP pyrophosphatase (non-canonical NTP hydrolase)